MSYASKIELVQNDYGYDLEFQLTDASGNPIDLTDATTVKLMVAEANKSTAKVVANCTVVDASNGVCKYIVQQNDFNEAPRQYDVEIEVTYSNKVVTAKGVVIKVLKELPETVS